MPKQSQKKAKSNGANGQTNGNAEPKSNGNGTATAAAPSTPAPSAPSAAEKHMQAILAKQKRANIDEGAPSVELRKDRINRLIAILVDNQDAICDAISDDFGHRSKELTLLTDVMASIGALKHSRDYVKRWMRPESRRPLFPLGLMGASAKVHYQPKGVVGVISPWNFPANLAFAPLGGVFAAGNRVMIKPSEYTPKTSELMKEMIGKAFDENEATVITGGPDVGGAFSRLPFDHLLFTGGTSIAYHVMRAAAENLVPLTLELGGKSPVIVSQTADISETAARVMNGKMMNAGQICLAPDYVIVPQNRRDEFVEHASNAAATMYPTLKENPDYTSIINQRHYDRLQSLLTDARQKGGNVIEINPAAEDFSQQPHHKMPPSLVLEPTEDMAVMQEEIFGPILPIKTYEEVEEAVSYVNEHPRPLGLYFFGKNRQEENHVLANTTAGGVTVNDVIMHISMEDLPFGGVGPSGMGSYHGLDGFREFSHAKAVYRQAWVQMAAEMFRPPFGEKHRKLLASQIKR